MNRTLAYERKTDNSPIRKFYDWATPWLQLIGFVVMCSFVVGTNYNKFEVQERDMEAIKQDVATHSMRLTTLEIGNARLETKIDDIMYHFGITPRERK